MPTFRNEKQRVCFLRGISSGSIIIRNGRYCPGNLELPEKVMEAQGTSEATATAMARRSATTSDFESLDMEMERLRLQAQATPEATATALAHRRFVIYPVYRSCYQRLASMLLSHRECTYSMYYMNLDSGSSVSVSNGSVKT